MCVCRKGKGRILVELKQGSGVGKAGVLTLIEASIWARGMARTQEEGQRACHGVSREGKEHGCEMRKGLAMEEVGREWRQGRGG